jgi:hypothetical protein
VKRFAALVGAVTLTTAGFATARFVVEPASAQSTKICSETCGPLTTSAADPATPGGGYQGVRDLRGDGEKPALACVYLVNRKCRFAGI